MLAFTGTLIQNGDCNRWLQFFPDKRSTTLRGEAVYSRVGDC